MAAEALSRDHLVLGRTIREIRARRGFTQEDLGFECGMHRNYVGAIERGEVNATFRTLNLVSDGLDVPLSTVILLWERRRGEDVRRPRRRRRARSAR